LGGGYREEKKGGSKKNGMEEPKLLNKPKRGEAD